MKKSMLLCFALVLLLSLFLSCNVDFNDGDSISAIMFVKHYDTGRRAPDWDVIHVPSVWVGGDISGSQIPEIDSLKIADIIYTGSEYLNYNQGDVHFSLGTRIWSDSIPAPHFDPLSIKIFTDNGELCGSITVPDTIESLTISAPDTVSTGTALTIFWTGSDADYYIVAYYHNWMPDEWTWLGYSRDTVVTTESVTFDSTYFIYNGDISYIEVIPFNGPFPEAGVEGNMDGDGHGYLFCENQSIESDRTIVIGEGINFSFFKGKKNMSTETMSVHEIIKKRLGL